jgi:hypothetical protein
VGTEFQPVTVHNRALAVTPSHKVRVDLNHRPISAGVRSVYFDQEGLAWGRLFRHHSSIARWSTRSGHFEVAHHQADDYTFEATRRT